MTLAPDADVVLTLFPVREHLESLTSRRAAIRLQPQPAVGRAGAQRRRGVNVPFNGSHGASANAPRTRPARVMDGGGGIHVDGARESQTLFILDGFNVGDPLNGGFDPRVSVEASSGADRRSGVYAAEFGKGSGGVIEVATHVGGDSRALTPPLTSSPTIVREKALRIQIDAAPVAVRSPGARQGVVLGRFIGEHLTSSSSRSLSRRARTPAPASA